MEAVLKEKTMKRYDTYKDSGVEWLGEVPEEWETLPLCVIAYLKSMTNHADKELLSVYLDKGVIRFRDINEKRTNVTSEDLSKYQFVEIGDLVINNQQAWRGSVGVSFYEGIVSPAYLVLSLFSKLDFQFANYLFRDGIMVSHYLISSKGVGTIQRNLYWPQLKRAKIILPSLREQVSISKFLNTKTAQIEKAIAIKEQQIALLKERRQILIHNAVTRGLNRDVKMKDSGVEWIGEVPEHWEVMPLRFIGKTQNGISKGAEYFGTGHPFVSYGDVYKSISLPKEVKGLANSSIQDREQYSVKSGDVLFTRTSETVSEIGFASTCLNTILNSTFAGFLIRFRPNENIIFKGFSKYYFSSKTHRFFFIKEMNLVIRASLSQELLKKMPVLIPPFEEQIHIATYLDNIVIKNQTAITLKEQEIERLKEYKATLINSAVTGKIKVS